VETLELGLIGLGLVALGAALGALLAGRRAPAKPDFDLFEATGEAWLLASPKGAVFRQGGRWRELVGEGLTALAAGDAALQARLEALAQDAALGRSGSLEVARSRGGIEGRLQVAVAPAGGRPPRLLWRAVDVTERRLAEDALQGRAARLTELLDAMPIGVAELDEADRIVGANRALESWLGTSRAELALRGVAWADVAAAAGEDDADPDSASRTVSFRRADGERFPALVTFPSLRGEFARRLALISDLSAERAWESVLSERVEGGGEAAHETTMLALGRMAGGIAHDFNNLLAAIVGHCDLLRAGRGAGAAGGAEIDQIRSAAERMAGLVRQLLAFAGLQTAKPKLVSPAACIDRMSQALRSALGERAELALELGQESGLARIDPDQFEQVMIGLARNAGEAMPAGGRVELKVERRQVESERDLSPGVLPAGDYVAVALTDHGRGVDPDHRARLFEPFFTTKPVGTGSGLGLAVAHGIVRQGGGWIGVESRLGQGTTMTIYWPRVGPTAAGETEAAAAPEAPPPPIHARILLAEDETPVRSFAARALRGAGHDVIECEDGEAASLVIDDRAQAIDLLLTDARMPIVDGAELVRRTLRHRPGVKVIVMSGLAEDSIRAELGQGAEVHFLAKPFALKALVARVDEVLRGAYTNPR